MRLDSLVQEHVGVSGNERANTVAQLPGAAPRVTFIILRSASSIKTTANRVAMKVTRNLFDTAVEEGFRSASWYATATRREPFLLPPHLTPGDDTPVIHLRLGHLCSTQIRQTESESCPHCLVDKENSLHHYLLRCPATQVLRPRVAKTQGTESYQMARVVAATTLSALIEMCTMYPPPC